MAENSKIEWTDHTFNPWEGCTKVSPGCEHCYAEALRDHRYGAVKWGKGQPRRRTSEANWKKPLQWNRAAEKARYSVDVDIVAGNRLLRTETQVFEGLRLRVFSASLADWLDDEVPIEWLADFLQLIYDTPNLDWLLLTKRPENWKYQLVKAKLHIQEKSGDDIHPVARWILDWLTGTPPPNVWIGTTVEDQTRADQRIPELLKIPAVVRFLSCEPLLGPVDLLPAYLPCPNSLDGLITDPETGAQECCSKCDFTGIGDEMGIHWVICGGESGKDARPMHPDWARSLRDQCQSAGVPFFFKQWGEWAPLPEGAFPDEEPWCDVPYGEFHDGGNWIECCLCPGGGPALYRVGKKTAGRLLDGREWNEFPEVAS